MDGLLWPVQNKVLNAGVVSGLQQKRQSERLEAKVQLCGSVCFGDEGLYAKPPQKKKQPLGVEKDFNQQPGRRDGL